MQALIARLTAALDRILFLERMGMYLAYYPEWSARHCGAWHDANGALIVQLGRHEFIADRGALAHP